MIWRPLRSTLFPYTTLFRSEIRGRLIGALQERQERTVGIDRTTHVFIQQDELSPRRGPPRGEFIDRKSTRLNSSHANISYAVFCLKKKKKTKTSSISLMPW